MLKSIRPKGVLKSIRPKGVLKPIRPKGVLKPIRPTRRSKVAQSRNPLVGVGKPNRKTFRPFRPVLRSRMGDEEMNEKTDNDDDDIINSISRYDSSSDLSIITLPGYR